MSSLEKKVFTYTTLVEVNDPSNDFIPYWNLAMQENLNNNFVTVDSDSKKSNTISFNSFNFKLIDTKEKEAFLQNEPIQLDKLFTIDVYRIKKEKDFTADFIKTMRQNYNINNINVVLYNIDDVKENVIKGISKIMEKLRSKTGLVDYSFIPYNEQFYPKFYSVFDAFFVSMKKKISVEYNNQLLFLLNTLNSTKDVYNSEEADIIYEYIKHKMMHLDLLTSGEFWDDIRNNCAKDLFKVFAQFKDKFIYKDCSSDINFMETKQKVKNKNINNIEYQLYLINTYMKCCLYLKDYKGLIQILFDSSLKLNIYKSFFESEYHFYYWIINYVLNLVNYLITFEEKLLVIEVDNKNTIKKGMTYLYSICLKYMKEYAKLFKYEMPSIKIFMTLKDWIDKGLNIKDELDKILNINNFEENNEAFNKFKIDVKSFDNFYLELNKNIFDVFTNKKIFLEEYLLILQIINKKNCEIFKLKNTVRNLFEITPILISLNKFDEAKNILNVLFQDKILFHKNKLNNLYEFICLLLIMLLYSSEKNNDNLKLMFKLFDANFTNVKYYLTKLDCKDENLVNNIISKFIDAYSDLENKSDLDDKMNKIFSLDKAINIVLEKKKDDIIFINKQKTNKEQIKYLITNNTGISFKVNKIQLIFEEFSINNKKDNKAENNEKNQIVYEINDEKNNFKCIESYVKSQENIFEIILDEKNDLFKLNTTYKFKQIKYIINNSLCGIYNIKDELKICFNSIEMKVSTQIYPSYDSSEFSSSLRNLFYYNTLSKIDINFENLPEDDLLNNKILKINFEDLNKKDDTKLIIQTYLLQEKLSKEFPDIIIKDNTIEFPHTSLKDKDKNKLNILIPFYIENINFYDNGTVSIKIKIEIVGQNEEDKDKIFYSFSSFHNINLIHLFNIRKKYRMINNNSIIMQTTFSLNIEATNIIVYSNNSNNFSFYMDSTQAINLVLLLKNNQDEITKKLRQNFLEFSLDDTINNEKKAVKYRLCYPEKSILEEIKELKEYPYYININVDENDIDIFKELNVNISIKKNNKKKVILLIHVCDNENWAVIGKSKFIEEWFNEKDKNEKNMKIKLLPLVDGFLKLPEIEFLEYEITEIKDDILKINENEENKNEFSVGKMNFDPIEYGTIIEGNEKVVNITPAKECSLKLNLT